MKKRHHFFNMYLTTSISIVLVLFLVGLEAVLVLSTHSFIEQIKENVVLSAVLSDEADSAEVVRLGNLLEIAPFVKSYHYTSKEEALQEHIQNLGEDPSEFLGFNPLLASYDIKLNADYAQQDSIDKVEKQLSVFQAVSRIVYQKDMVKALDSNVTNVTIFLFIAAVILLFVSIALMVNTIRLSIYSKRFTINTMKLVGATPWVIKAPIVGRNVLMGLISGVVAIVLLGAALWYCEAELGLRLMTPTWYNALIVSLVVLLSGVLITFISSLFATRRYIRMKTDDLYYV